jgi:hypothetical protein
MNVTTEDLLDAMRAALATPADGEGATLAELAVAMKCGQHKARMLLRAIHAEGRLEVVRMHRQNMIGGTSVVPAYRIKPK